MPGLRWILLAMLSLIAALPAAESADVEEAAYEPWPEEVIAAFRQIPVQHEGRIMPLSTALDYFLLRIHGARTIEVGDERLQATAWFLDLLFRPDVVADAPLFQVDDSAVATAVGIDISEHDRRDRYSLAEVLHRQRALMEQGAKFSSMPEDDRSLVDQQVLDLAINFRDLELLLHNFRFLDTAKPLAPENPLAHIFGPGTVRFSDLLEHLPVFFYGPVAMARQTPAESRTRHHTDTMELYTDFYRVLDVEEVWPMLWPPLQAEDDEQRRFLFEVDTDLEDISAEAERSHFEEWRKRYDEEWWNSADLAKFHRSARLVRQLDEHRRTMQLWERFGLSVGRDRAEQIAAARALRDHTSNLARAHPSAADAPFVGEETYHRYQLVYRSLVVYVFAFVLVCALWLAPRNRWLFRIAYAVTALATLILVADVTWRCLLRGRPPVTTLYDTVLFVTGSAAILCLFMEAVNRQRIALSLGAVLGVIGLFVARSYEVTDAEDTMPQLQAVLDTNFWLGTHVVTVTLGYAAGMLAAAIAHVSIFARGIALVSPRPALSTIWRQADRMVYGVIAFGVVFATVGTILGGIWANESWGRFWGWDPKENGALMIVLAMLAILHARMGGFLPPIGVATAAVGTGIVVAFSWWGTNLLDVGLHSYGHTSGVGFALNVFYVVETVVLAAGIAVWWLGRKPRPPSSPQAIADGEGDGGDGDGGDDQAQVASTSPAGSGAPLSGRPEAT